MILYGAVCLKSSYLFPGHWVSSTGPAVTLRVNGFHIITLTWEWSHFISALTHSLSFSWLPLCIPTPGLPFLIRSLHCILQQCQGRWIGTTSAQPHWLQSSYSRTLYNIALCTKLTQSYVINFLPPLSLQKIIATCKSGMWVEIANTEKKNLQPNEEKLVKAKWVLH